MRGTGGHVPVRAVNNPVHYLLNSKRAAEEVVRAAPVPWAIARPSVVIGDAVTGEIASLQALHAVAPAVARNLVPLVPVQPDARIDFIPSDTVARALAEVEEPLCGEFWLTGGTALEAVAVLRVITHPARRRTHARRLRLVNPETWSA